MARPGQVVFRIFYSTSFTVVFLVLISFICFTPADALYESYKRRRLLDIFLLAGDYVVTALVASLIYASRIYTNRSVLKDIPKTFMPVEKEDLPGRRVHKLIQECLERSAVIAYQTRPRSKRIEHDAVLGGAGAGRMLAITKSRTSSDQSAEPRWGRVAHPGWSSPASKENANLEYATVVDELTDLVEAKAVSLAPADAHSPDGVDPRVVDALTRPESMGMRSYLEYLIGVGVLDSTPLAVAFLTAYERARFSPEPIREEDFQSLMRMFAELLRNMLPVDVDLLDLDAVSVDDADASYGQPSIGPPSMVEQYSPLRQKSAADLSSLSSAAASSTFSSDAGSVVHHHHHPPRRVSEDSAPSLSSVERHHYNPTTDDDHDADDDADADERSLRTAPTTRATSAARSGSRLVSAASRLGLRPHHSSRSLRSRHSSRPMAGSRRSSSGRSNHSGFVTRLAPQRST
jgi:hypothetical protein